MVTIDRITAKRDNILLNPSQRQSLIFETKVGNARVECLLSARET